MSVENVAAFTEGLTKALPASLFQAMGVAINAAADDMIMQMKSLAPPGRIAASIRKREIESESAVDNYAVLITAGGSGTVVDNARGEHFQLARIIEFGTLDHRHPARPFFFPIYRAQRTQARRKISGALNRAVQRFSASDSS